MTVRPIYESQETLAKETAAKQIVESAWSCSLLKLPRRYEIDFLADRDDQAVAFVELKCRTNPKDQYADYMLSLGKWLAGLNLTRCTGLPFLLVVQWTDCLGYLTQEESSRYKIGTGGRYDRNDPQDIEPCIYIPVNEFKLIGE